MIAHLPLIRRITLPIVFGTIVVLVLLKLGEPSPHEVPSPRMTLVTSEPTTPVATAHRAKSEPSPDHSIELATPWPEVLPCERFATLAIHGGTFEHGMPIAWHTQTGAAIDATAPFTSRATRLPAGFRPAEHVRLRIAHELDEYQSIWLELACAGDREARIDWDCRRPYHAPLEPPKCNVSASYPTTRFARFPNPRTPVARQLLAGATPDPEDWLMKVSDDLVKLATRIVIEGCADQQCTPMAHLFVEKLATLREVAPRKLRTAAVIPNFHGPQQHSYRATWDLADGALQVSCSQMLCSLYHDPHSWLMTQTDDYVGVRIDDNAYVALRPGHLIVGDNALRLRGITTPE